jgi:hypothetical protein
VSTQRQVFRLIEVPLFDNPTCGARRWTLVCFYGSAIKMDLTNMKMDATYTVIDMATGLKSNRPTGVGGVLMERGVPPRARLANDHDTRVLDNLCSSKRM